MSKNTDDIEVWDNFVLDSLDMLKKSCYNTRVNLKYRNKPARGKINVTNNSKVRKFNI